MKLELVDMSNYDDDDSGDTRFKRRVFESNQMVAIENEMCPAGSTSIPFTFQMPNRVNLPQSFYFAERWGDFRCKLRYFFKAQLVPVSLLVVDNEWGKSKVRDRQRVHYSPVRPVVCDPQFNVLVPF